MIQKLVQDLTELLRANFKENDNFKEPDKQIQSAAQPAPDTALLPVVALYPGKLTASQKIKELSPGQPRPQEESEQLLITNTEQATSFRCKHLPLPGSVRCRLTREPDTLTERSSILVEKKDFTLDYTQGVINFSESLPLNSRLLVQYSFAGIFTLSEFKQDLFIDVFAKDAVAVEQWSALALAITLTAQTELLDRYNSVTNSYSSGAFAVSSNLTQIWLQEICPTSDATLFKTQLHFQVQGQLKLTKELADNAALIQKIHSPGRNSDAAVDIEVLLD